MARLLSFLVSAVVISGLLLSAVTPASACTCGLPSLEQLVGGSDVIVIGSAGEFYTDPPLDPSTPVNLEHRGYVRFTTEEYLKGGGPQAFAAATNTIFTFNNGGVVEGISTCSLLGEGSAGVRYVLFLNGPLENAADPGTCSGSIDLARYPGADQYLDSLRNVLSQPERPLVDLPRTGGRNEGRSSATIIVTTAALGTLVLGAGLIWRSHGQRPA